MRATIHATVPRSCCYIPFLNIDFFLVFFFVTSDYEYSKYTLGGQVLYLALCLFIFGENGHCQLCF